MPKIAPVLALVALFQTGALLAEGLPDFRVISHPGVKGAKVARETLADIFLKKTLRWGDGSPIQPVERSLTSPLRAGFSRKVLGRSTAEVQIYWAKAMRDGIRPPVVKETDEEVLAFVSATPGAVGYVAAELELPPTVKTLDVQ
jgi:ABC-type phosphate transport system substrate-binding protein